MFDFKVSISYLIFKGMKSMKTTAIVLSGGKGSRMGYKEKAWIMHREKPLLSHVIDSVSTQVDTILISRNNIKEPKYDKLPYKCISDQPYELEHNTFPVRAQLGPLAGIRACAMHVSTTFTLVVPCDLPRLPRNLVSELKSGIFDADIAVAFDGQIEQPLVFLAKTKVLETIDDYLISGKSSVKGWLNGVRRKRILFEDGADFFENINTPDQTL